MTGHDDFLALNILSPHAGAATFACVFISHFVEAKSKTNTADLCVYYSLFCNIRFIQETFGLRNLNSNHKCYW